jgi:hypothetical protein
MKRSVAAVIIATLVILATDLGAHGSVCDLFFELEKYDSHQLTLTGDLIMSKDIAVVGAAEADLLRPQGKTVRASATFDPKQVHPVQECTPPSRAELCAKPDTLPRAAQRDCADKVRELLAAKGIDSKNGNESEALITAIRAGNKDIVEILLQAGAPVNPSQTALWPPLSDAAFTKHFEIMKLLLQSGAKVDAPDHHGDTLLVSTGFFDPTVTTILLDAGANPDASDREGQTPLMKASARGFKQSVKILLDHHADVNRKDVKGRTALMHAAASSFSDAIPVLLENGADPNARDKEGKSALDLADNSNNLGALAMLTLAVKRSH